MASHETSAVKVTLEGGSKTTHVRKTAAKDYGWDEDWREQLVAAQEAVVHSLQLAVVHESTGRPYKSGEVKDIAVALGVAVDKLQVLTELYPTSFFGPDAAPTGVLVGGTMSNDEVKVMRAWFARLPKADKHRLAQSPDQPFAPAKAKEVRG